jgi:hypothetical protein
MPMLKAVYDLLHSLIIGMRKEYPCDISRSQFEQIRALLEGVRKKYQTKKGTHCTPFLAMADHLPCSACD